jgi:hypothetical protein
MRNTETISGTYRSQNTPTEIFLYHKRRGGTWYVCEGSKNVNFTYDEIKDGVNIEELRDDDIITSNSPIESEEQLRELIED